MNDRITACTFIHPRKTIVEGVALAATLGVREVDIGAGGANGHWTPEFVAKNAKSLAAETLAALRQHDLKAGECLALNLGPHINSPDEADKRHTIAHFPGLVDYAAAVGCRSVMLIAGPVQPKLGPRGSIERAAEVLGELCETARARGVQLNLEPDSESCVNRPELAAQLCEMVPKMKLTLDYSHFISEGIAQSDVEQLHRFTGHMHMRQAAPGQIVAGVDGGTIDLPRMLASLKRDGYAGRFTVEYLQLSVSSHLNALSESRRIIHELDALLDSV